MARRDHSRLGLGIFVMLVVTYAAQIIVYFAVDPEITSDGVTALILSYVPMYCIAFPAAYFIIRTVPRHPLGQEALGAKRFFRLLVIGWFLMYGGNIFGSMVNAFISEKLGIAIRDPIEALILSDMPMPVLFVLTVVIAPILEELIFRRLLIDRMNIYGQGTAIVTTALMFGLFHGNLSQFFYAMALGLIFGYVYVRTGRLRYSIFMHMIVNFWGGIVSGALVTDENVTALIYGSSGLEDLSDLQYLITPTVILFMLYALATFVLVIAGLVLFFKHRGSISLDTAEMQIPRGSVFRTVWLNAGMISFTLSCLAVMLLNIYADQLL